MSSSILLQHATGKVAGIFSLPASKSEANRALIISALSQGMLRVENISEAEDTRIMQRLLDETGDGELNVGHAGTVMRFMTAFLAFQPYDRILTGTDRMLQRPIGPLVSALRVLGAEIEYLGEEGYPPLYIFGRNARFGERHVQIRGDISSQFISALLMLGPTRPDGLKLEITTPLFSRPYVEMTIKLMERYGAKVTWRENIIEVAAGGYQPGTFQVESDWSAAGYGYSSLALAREGSLFLPGLRQDSLQGDAGIAGIMEVLGVRTHYEEKGIRLEKSGADLPANLELDLLEMPDQAQTIFPLCAALGVSVRCTGLESLRIKETDRVAALQNELAHFGVALTEPKTGVWEMSGDFSPSKGPIRTYDDHRMAMGFAPLALRCPDGLLIEEGQVVKKSFPRFWSSLQGIGFEAAQVAGGQ